MTVKLSSRNRKQQPLLRISSKKTNLLLGLILLASTVFFLSSVRTPYTKDHHLGGIHQQLKDFRKTNKRSQSLESGAKKNGDVSSEQLEVQSILLRTINRKSLPLKAYTEPPLQSGTPLPVRVKPELQEYTYPNVNGCGDLQNSLPVHHPQELDERFSPIVGQLKPLYPVRQEYAQKVCPVDADPFLPWIHDVFLTVDGRYVDFVAHNKRRCRTAPSFADDLKNLEPQVALLQSVPIKRVVSDDDADDEDESGGGQQNKSRVDGDDHSSHAKNRTTTSHRYRLASLEDADEDAKETRFICQFHTLRPNADDNNNNNSNKKVERVIVGETLSVYPYNYEHANFRKGSPLPHPLLTRPKDGEDIHGAHNEHIWNAILHFRCPVPETIKSSFRSDPSSFREIPKFYVDLVPIRTPPRESREGYCPQIEKSSFDPDKEWGKNHVLPPVEESGRWANIPICRPTETTTTKSPAKKHGKKQEATNNGQEKKNVLVGCLWASAAFSTRGSGELDTSTQFRLLEWLTFHLKIAKFDHIYIYDNSGAHSETASLEPVVNLFPSNRVTRIPWRHRICNNNRPMHRNIGERSSQYAAEASCRLRYGPETEWLISFDTDEYLIPQSNWTDLKSWLMTSRKNGKITNNTHILSFFQTRALPNVDYMDPYVGKEPECRSGDCLAKQENATFLEAYDCEQTSLPKPDYGWRAKKQMYRPDFVLNHFVHYTTVTRRVHEAPKERSPAFVQGHPYERRVDELTEAFMLHTKTTNPSSTKDWQSKCRDPKNPKNCPVGIPFPTLKTSRAGNHSANGLAHNCYPHERVQNEFKQKLEQLLRPLRNKYFSIGR
jgi:hypothetical protein